MKGFVVLVLASCTTTHVVPKSQLDAIASAQRSDAIVLHTTSSSKTRLDPHAQIRFHSRDGKWSNWVIGEQLYTTPEGVYTDATVDVLEYAMKIEIRGLDATGREALELARPAGAELHIDIDDTAVMLAA